MAVHRPATGRWTTAVTVRVVSVRNLPASHLPGWASRPCAVVTVGGLQSGPAEPPPPRAVIPPATTGNCGSPKWEGDAGEARFVVPEASLLAVCSPRGPNDCATDRETALGLPGGARGGSAFATSDRACGGGNREWRTLQPDNLGSFGRALDNDAYSGDEDEEGDGNDEYAARESSSPHVRVELFSSPSLAKSLGFAIVPLTPAIQDLNVPQAGVYPLHHQRGGVGAGATRCLPPFLAGAGVAAGGGARTRGTMFVEVTVGRAGAAADKGALAERSHEGNRRGVSGSGSSPLLHLREVQGGKTGA
eukprot:TRINITY_DN6257_c0_g1_i1.p1 TRINITY_DN6257_c0_g1~~TRINITY_DN6257_c0_g1_i1.p1  ORF type:complete len:305 (-),score=-35.79 TRINITY_DN6257_c0_g1_i1:659-1573(-)